MDKTRSTPPDDEWVIWNSGHGLVTTAALGRIEPDGNAWLAEPFDMVGPFSLTELQGCGRIAFAACIVMSRSRWQTDQAALRQASATLRRAARQQAGAFSSHFGARPGAPYKTPTQDEGEHREILKLPAEGKLERRQINTAFRRLAQKAHPDAGGSHEHFVRIAKARTALLAAIS